MSDLSTKELARATNATEANAAIYLPHLNAAMARFKINTPRRVAAFLANVSIETARLTAMEESLFYRDGVRLASIYPRAFKTPADAAPYVGNPKGLSMLLYAGYHGRGCLQLTHLRNYIAASAAIGVDYAKDPALVKTPEHAALTGAWFFSDNGCNQFADQRDIDMVRKRINGPAKLHMREVSNLFNDNLEWMEVQK